MELSALKTGVFTSIGVFGGLLANALGGWDAGLQTLLIFVAIDILTGWMVAFAGKSIKTESGGVQSSVGFLGLLRKGAIFGVIIMANQMDAMTGMEVARTGAIISYIVNEGISITENLGLLGVPVPDVVVNAFEVLKKKKQ